MSNSSNDTAHRRQTVGFLYPGKMGATLAASAACSANIVTPGEGRSVATRRRADDAGLTDVGTMAELCAAADIVVSICPPAAAVQVADDVVATGFKGIYLDANAISPETSRRIGAKFERYVDGGVIGPPAKSAGTTRMYLAGADSAELARLWDGSALDVRVLLSADSSGPAAAGSASALKMAYAGWTKGQIALLLAINALAASAGVHDALRAEWEISQPGLAERSESAAGPAGAKAWRFAGEMNEIAATMAHSGLPDGFHRAAEELYERLATFKDQEGTPLSAVLAELLGD